MDTIMSRRRNTTTPVVVVPAVENSADPSIVTTPVVDVAAVAVAPDAPVVPWYVGSFDAVAYRAAVVAAEFADAGVVATLTSPACIAIAAGLVAVRATADTADAVNVARATFDAVAGTYHAPTSAATVNVGRYMGRKIMDGQNVIYAVAAIVHAPDAAIAVAWRTEWPGAKCDFAVRRDHVTTTRPVVNRGGHGWTNGHNGTPDVVRAWGGPFRRYTTGGDAR
jgi:hypothetical protein